MDPQFVFLDHQQRCAISVPGLHDSDPDRVEQRQFGKSNSGPQPVDECTLSIQVYCQNGSLPDLDARDQRILDLLDHVARTVITGLSECRFIPQLPHPYTGYRIEVYHGQPNLRDIVEHSSNEREFRHFTAALKKLDQCIEINMREMRSGRQEVEVLRRRYALNLEFRKTRLHWMKRKATTARSFSLSEEAGTHHRDETTAERQPSLEPYAVSQNMEATDNQIATNPNNVCLTDGGQPSPTFHAMKLQQSTPAKQRTPITAAMRPPYTPSRSQHGMRSPSTPNTPTPNSGGPLGSVFNPVRDNANQILPNTIDRGNDRPYHGFVILAAGPQMTLYDHGVGVLHFGAQIPEDFAEKLPCAYDRVALRPDGRARKMTRLPTGREVSIPLPQRLPTLAQYLLPLLNNPGPVGELNVTDQLGGRDFNDRIWSGLCQDLDDLGTAYNARACSQAEGDDQVKTDPALELDKEWEDMEGDAPMELSD